MNEGYGWNVFTAEKIFYIDTINMYFMMQKLAGALSEFQMIGFIILFFFCYVQFLHQATTVEIPLEWNSL